MRISLLVRFIIIILIVLVTGPGLASQAQDFPDVCQQPENILANCNFSSGLDGWRTFTEDGAASFSVLQGGGECHAPLCPAAYIVTNSHFVGGLYQQVPVGKGNNYYANVVWLVFDSLANDPSINQATGGIGRRIGIDPFGGTDSRSPNVVWSEDNWRNDCKICNVEHVTVTAQADTITVFLRIDDTWKLRAKERGYPVPASDDKFWVDDIGLKQVGGEAVVAAPPATDTPAPTETPLPVPTATPAPPTNTPAPAPEVEPATPVAETNPAQVEPISPVATPTAAPTSTPIPPPPTLTPTVSPSPTSTIERRVRPTATRVRQVAGPPSQPSSGDTSLLLGAVGTTACLGGIFLLLAAAVLAGLVWIYRLGWGAGDSDDLAEAIDAGHDLDDEIMIDNDVK